jgi:hypothetical protein
MTNRQLTSISIKRDQWGWLQWLDNKHPDLNSSLISILVGHQLTVQREGIIKAIAQLTISQMHQLNSLILLRIHSINSNKKSRFIVVSQ